jgi:hypothetical protein
MAMDEQAQGVVVAGGDKRHEATVFLVGIDVRFGHQG